jgi:hypothetical protein
MSAVMLSACAHAAPLGPAVLATNEKEPPPRQPDGVALDVSAAHVDARTSAPARGVVALCPPPSREEALTLVRAYFRAFAARGGHEFAALLTRDARRLGDAGTPPDLLTALDHRVANIDYARAPLESMVAYDDARIIAYDAAPATLRHMDLMVEGDVLVDVPVGSPLVANVRLFGPKVALVLRRDEPSERWRIAGVNEDGPWP